MTKPRAKPGGREPYSGRTALLVEAEAGTHELCRSALSRLGFAVDAVETGVAAMSAARGRPPDIILFDWQLRDVSGRELVGWFRSNPAFGLTPMIAIGTLGLDGAQFRYYDGRVERC